MRQVLVTMFTAVLIGNSMGCGGKGGPTAPSSPSPSPTPTKPELPGASGRPSVESKQPLSPSEKLVGKWERKNAPKGEEEVMEFMKDGKVIIGPVSKKEDALKGKYKIEGNKLTIILDEGKDEIKDESTILKLTDTELIYALEGSKNPRTYTRVK